MTDGEALLRAVVANPDEDTAALALADWFAEHGNESLARALRGGVQLRRDPTVYLVTRGVYSSYRVVGVFTSRENAEQFMVAIPPNGGYGNDYNDVEEYRLDEWLSIQVAGWTPWYVQLNTDGNTVGRPTDPQEVPLNDRGRVYNHAFTIYVWARDREHAVKVAAEKRAAAMVDPTRVSAGSG